ncbi:Fic family protein [Candidatus Magnetaquicoccus inordinatus]|uniref:Fic family protein n=1 Tax=Candidatus Magnetaquicoccus inordinatus TaxID=2496818 RepID=UPI00102B03B2|nr:Fic family protein [Candidatus Magnetaquicoccus inordinatus]
MEYHFISDLDAVVDTLRNSELDALSRVWREIKEELENSGEYKLFVNKLQREWAIETGIIERLYTWDRGVTEILIDQGIDAALIAHKSGISQQRAANVASIINDQKNIIEGLFAFVRGEQPLTHHYIRQLHAEFTAHQDTIDVQTSEGNLQTITLLKGEYKRYQNNPLRQDGSIYIYCPPEHVQQEMDNLLAWFVDKEETGEKPEVLSAFLHHRFTQIHPFQDGNGRVARALASLVFLKNGLFPLVIRDSERNEYIISLEKADAGDLKPLCDLFARNQKKSILSAISIEQSIQRPQQAEVILRSSLEKLKIHFQAEASRRDEVFKIAQHLQRMTDRQLEEYATIFNNEIKGIKKIPGVLSPLAHLHIEIFSNKNNDQNKRSYFRRQITEFASQIGYFANFDSYCSCSYLTIHSNNRFQCVISFHGLGPVHQGIMVATGFTLLRIPNEEKKGSDVLDPRLASAEIFQFNYLEPIPAIETRFAEWLNETLSVGFSEWHKVITRETMQ